MGGGTLLETHMAKAFDVDTANTLTTGLVSWYNLEDTSDDFGSNTLTNTNSVAFATGKIGNAADTDASNTTKRLTNALLTAGTTSMSVSAWVKIRSYGSGKGTILGYTFHTSGATNDVSFGINIDNTSSGRILGYRLREAVAWDEIAYGITDTTSFHHVVVTYNGTTLTLWVDGVNRASGAYSGAGSNTYYDTGLSMFGRRHATLNTLDNPTSAVLDLMGIWSKSLSNTEIADLYNAGAGNAYREQATTFVRAMADSVMNAASRTSPVSRLFSVTRSLSDSVMNAASRFATVTAIRSSVVTLSDSMMNAAGRLSTLSHGFAFLRTMSDTLMNSAGRTDSLARLASFTRAKTDSMMNAAGRLATLSRSAVSIVRTMSDSVMNAAGRFSSLKTFLNGLDSRYSETHPRRGTSYDQTYPHE